MKLQNKAYVLILLVLLQSISIFFIITNGFIQSYASSFIYTYPLLLILFLNVLGVAAIINVFYLFSFLKKEEESIRKLNHSIEVIEALRGQKHDFNNHLNVVAGMIKLDKYVKALEYIYDICGKTDETFSISKIENVEVAAILYRKAAIAENKGITVEFDISTDLNYLTIEPIELSKVFFNLLDNAIYELDAALEEEKILTIDIKEDKEKYIIMIGNSYPVLSPELFDRIFEAGYTTKAGPDHGFGLDIVNRIVKKNNGTVSVESYESIGTLFTVFLPKSKK
ncbi:sensor histidine kinase [Alkaliphilus peptidifermentans]|uniref:histidine kinase n=1 Tax=Alkaliphilus peptidifermentans DSM 18978 TaxID=1120976 RepID=A0A1G5KRK0_9FIRM|nr:ATP-binding protein [Alkaliphilus peptidifermentans]SCZ03293.1 Sensor_kinase_SpoOB-type, alpha-helical domain [Alkaliphilus peptidifermentans DSM 18978]